MMDCASCGATDQNESFCVRCGTRMKSAGPATLRRPQSAGPTDTTILAATLPPPPPLPPPAPSDALPQNPFDPPGATPRRRTGVIAAVVVAVAAVVVAGVGVWFLVRPPDQDGTGAAVQTASLATTVPSPSATASAASGGQRSAASTRPAPVATAGPVGSSVAQWSTPSVNSTYFSTSTTTWMTTTSQAITTTPLLSRGTGDLGLTRPISSLGCTSEYVAIIDSAYDPATNSAKVQDLLDTWPDASYILDTVSCAAFNPTLNGNPIYAIYLGPFRSQAEACAARDRVGGDAYVKVAAPNVAPDDAGVEC